jgi:glucosamine 6-phosphate synthetase-like amidotransferase/phosphosugar isomerase protein
MDVIPNAHRVRIVPESVEQGLLAAARHTNDPIFYVPPTQLLAHYYAVLDQPLGMKFFFARYLSTPES